MVRPDVLIVFTVVIAVGIQDRPASAPQTDTAWVSDYKIVGNPTFVQAIAAVSQLVFAYSGTPGFFAIVSEMRNPRQYTLALLICQTSLTALYIIIGCVVYYYCGSYVSSPALGSAGATVKKVSYGIALPGLIVTTTIVAHVRFAEKKHLGRANTLYTMCLDSREIHLYPHPPRLQTPKQQQSNTLDHLA